jgi:hypothetical protein
VSDGPVIVAGNEKFRIVRAVSGNYVTEIYDECDALGVERWREAKLGEAKANTITLMFRDYIISQAVRAEKGTADAEG